MESSVNRLVNVDRAARNNGRTQTLDDALGVVAIADGFPNTITVRGQIDNQLIQHDLNLISGW